MRTTSIFMSILALALQLRASDAWVEKGSDPEYPNTLYFTGVGLSERGVEEARTNAIVDVKKQISVTIKASVLDEQVSRMVDGKETYSASNAETRARLSTQGDVQGIEVVKTAKKGGVHYAFAVLDKKKFSSNMAARIDELNSELKTLVDGARTDIDAGKIGSALMKLATARRNITQIHAQRTLMSAAAEITKKQQAVYSETDIALLYEKCVSGIEMKKAGGDKQEFPVGKVPAEPFVVTVTASKSPVPMIMVKLLDENDKTVMEKFTDQRGVAEFFLGEKADVSAGRHTYTAVLKMKVSSKYRKMLKSQNQTFSYKVISQPCYTRIEVTVPQELRAHADLISQKVIRRLGKYDVKQDHGAPHLLKADVTAEESGSVDGLSKSSSFVRSEISLRLSLFDGGGRELVSLDKSGRGMGSTPAKAVAKGIDKIRIKSNVKEILDHICTAQSGPKKKIAVFAFKNAGHHFNWYDLSHTLADMVITRLINTGRFEVVERMRLSRIMEERKLAESGIVEQSEAMKIAKVAGADLILLGTASIVGGKIEIDARIVDAVKGTAVCGMSSSGFALSELRALANDLVAKIRIP